MSTARSGKARDRRAEGRSRRTAAGKRGGGRKQQRDRFSRRLLRWSLYWGTVAAIWLMIAGIAVVGWYAYDLPDVRQIAVIDRRPAVVLHAADGTTLASFGDLYGEPIRLDELPPALPRAVLATEDRRFYSHFGLDVIGLARAVVANLRAGRLVQGGSTITQQLAKNVFLTPDRTFKRKIQELLLAFWLEHNFTKDEILTLYLNRVYLGAGTYGVEAAAQRYFGKSAREVNLAEAAMLAGLLKAPSRYAPTRDIDAARRRAEVVLANMLAVDYIDEATAARATAHPAALSTGGPGQGARYFADWILDRVTDYVGHAERDLVVLTTLDSKLQALAERAVTEALAAEGEEQGVSQAALVALSPDGAIRAMVGGRDYAESQFNRAAQARRQPGSAFKPVIYLAGLEAGLTPDSMMVDEPVTLNGWSPQNNSGRHVGPVTVREALARSINTVAVKVLQRAGAERTAEVALRLGITSRIPTHPSIALGTEEVTPLELTAAYAPFANGGEGVLTHGILEIRVKDGGVLYRRQGAGPGEVIRPEHVGAMNDMLAATMTEGSGKAARLDRPAGGKTGTTQDFRDAWFLGYTAQLVAGVWVGNDDGGPMRSVTGSGLPARIWRDFMQAAHAGVPARPLPSPEADWRRDGESFLSRLIERLSGGGTSPSRQPASHRPSISRPTLRPGNEGGP